MPLIHAHSAWNFHQPSSDSDGKSPTLAVVFPTSPDQVISKATLHDFRINVLERDDVFCPEFCRNVVSYSSPTDQLTIHPDFLEELATWNTQNYVFAESGGCEGQTPQGPYVCFQARTWQPWRVYVDFNPTFMATFKSSNDGSGR